MLEFLGKVLSSDFLPGGDCFRWQPELVWLHVGADVLITLAYYSIPVTIFYFVRRRSDLAFHRMFLVFAAFLLAGGTTHLMAIWTVWFPAYHLEAAVKLGTGILSVVTAVLLISIVPRGLALPSSAQLESANRALERQVRERERAENELSQALKEVSRLMETVPDIICMVDREGRLVRWNRRLETATGRSAGELAGRQAADLFAPEDAPAVRAEIAAVIAGGYAEVDANLLTQDGTPVAYHFVGVPLEDEQGRLVGITQVGRDVSERKRAARLTASLQEKEILLKELHHRVKNNLQVITSLLSLQSGYVHDAEALEMFKESQNRVRLMAMIHEALYRSENLSRLDGASFIREITRNLLRAYAVDPEAIRIDVDVDGAAMGIETAVPCGLIINELVSNALKHAFRRTSRGEIRVRLRSDGTGRYVLEVRDNGCGLPDMETWRRPRSLGWQLVHALTDQLGGTVDVRSVDGTEFIVTFPEQR